ncbi:MAG: YchF/TatD family DNA exonuclease [Thermodesulfobacteriota bacterium]
MTLNNFHLIDTHAHLDMDQFCDEKDEIIRRAEASGIENIITIGSNLESCRSAIKLAESHPSVFAAVGVHPHDASDVDSHTLKEIKTLAKHPKVVAIGETGLDYYYLNSPKEVQKETFRAFINVARELNLPLILHVREAQKDALAILREEELPERGGVTHCFSGSYEDAKSYMDLGFYISYTGVLTFPNAHSLREAAKKISIEKILIETDSPYLAPVPKRGKRNEPSYVRYIAEKIAEIKGLSLQDVGRITTLNAKNLFNLPGADDTTQIAYPIRNSLYLNITNRCTLTCTFCAKFKDYSVKGHYLKLAHEPSLDDVFKAMGDYKDFNEVVFCGYGEPLLRLDLVKDITKILKKEGIRVRINTDGLANLVYKRDITAELKGLVDSISVSLNAPDSETYEKHCKSKFGKDAYKAVKEFIIKATAHVPDVTATVVALPGLDVEACRSVVEKELGVTFRVREYNEVG